MTTGGTSARHHAANSLCSPGFNACLLYHHENSDRFLLRSQLVAGATTFSRPHLVARISRAFYHHITTIYDDDKVERVKKVL